VHPETDESLWDFIRHFSKRCTELLSVAQSEIVHTFLEGTTCRDFVRELRRSPPVDSNELFDIATSFASGEEVVGAIFDGKKGKRVDDAPAEGSKSKELQQKQKRGNKPRRDAHAQGHDDDEDEALAVDSARKGPRAAPRGPGVFDDMLKKPCPYHKTPVKHTLEQCDMLKKYFSRTAAKDGEAKKDGRDGDVGGFPRWRTSSSSSGGQQWTCPTVSASGSDTRSLLRRGLPLLPRLVGGRHHLQPQGSPEPHPQPRPVSAGCRPGHQQLAVLQGADGRRQQPQHLVRAHPAVDGNWVGPVATQHDAIPWRRTGQARPALGQVDLPVWFGTLDNFRKEILTFEVVGFRGAYHTILGCPCYAKFMAVPNYTYLKMKMPGPKGVITVGSSIEHAFDCDVECVEHAEALALDEALVMNLEKLVDEDLDSSAKHAGNFEAAEQTKEVPLDPAAPKGKVLRVSSTFDLK
jgi:hypothetical protein